MTVSYPTLLKALERWAKAHGCQVVVGPPLTSEQIGALPKALLSAARALPTPYRPADFTVPPSWADFLSRHASLQVRGPKGERFGPVDLWAPTPETLTRSWVPAGTTVDERPITTTSLLSFANGGFKVEASRWCFLTGHGKGGGGELPILMEDNDYECLTGYYADDGEPLSKLMAKPPFTRFDAWFSRLVEVVTSAPPDFERPDDVVNAVLTKKTPKKKKSR